MFRRTPRIRGHNSLENASSEFSKIQVQKECADDIVRRWITSDWRYTRESFIIMWNLLCILYKGLIAKMYTRYVMKNVHYCDSNN